MEAWAEYKLGIKYKEIKKFSSKTKQNIEQKLGEYMSSDFIHKGPK